MMTRIFVLIFLITQSNTIKAQFSQKRILYSGNSSVNEVIVSDINGDLANDIICSTSNEVLVYINKGNHEFSEFVLDRFALFNFSAAHTADFDGDGYIDIVTSTAGTGEILWYKNHGDTSFSRANFIDFSLLSRYVTCGDLDNDGDQDVIANNLSTRGDNVVYYENIGDGEFSEAIFLTNRRDSLKNIENILPFDIDEDGDLDVFITDLIYDRVWFVENLGVGVFDSAIVIGENLSGAQAINIADYDNDGNFDIAIAARNVFRGLYFISYLSQGRFSRPRRLNFTEAIFQLNSLFTVDVDDDGDLDICFSDDTGGNVGYFENQGEFLSFKPIIIFEEALDPNSVFASDLDNDGDIELVYALQDGNEVGYFINDQTTSILSLDNNISIEIVPNPSSQFIHINTLTEFKSFEIFLYSLKGQLLFNKSISRSEEIDISALRKGSYIVLLRTNSGVSVNKFIKN